MIMKLFQQAVEDSSFIFKDQVESWIEELLDEDESAVFSLLVMRLLNHHGRDMQDPIRTTSARKFRLPRRRRFYGSIRASEDGQRSSCQREALQTLCLTSREEHRG